MGPTWELEGQAILKFILKESQHYIACLQLACDLVLSTPLKSILLIAIHTSF